MRTIHISMTDAFQCEYCTFKRCDKFKLKCSSHGGIPLYRLDFRRSLGPLKEQTAVFWEGGARAHFPNSGN